MVYWYEFVKLSLRRACRIRFVERFFARNMDPSCMIHAILFIDLFLISSFVFPFYFFHLKSKKLWNCICWAESAPHTHTTTATAYANFQYYTKFKIDYSNAHCARYAHSILSRNYFNTHLAQKHKTQIENKEKTEIIVNSYASDPNSKKCNGIANKLQIRNTFWLSYICRVRSFRSFLFSFRFSLGYSLLFCFLLIFAIPNCVIMWFLFAF